MPTYLERVDNLLRIIEKYEKSIERIKDQIKLARKKGTLAEVSLGIIAMIEDFQIDNYLYETLTEERVRFRVNAPKAEYQRRRRDRLKLAGSLNKGSSNSQEVNPDFNIEDDF